MSGHIQVQDGTEVLEGSLVQEPQYVDLGREDKGVTVGVSVGVSVGV